MQPVYSSLTRGLNPAQAQAVMHLHGPCLVLAGAGSGKTRVITHKIARLIEAGLAPERIAAITFTNKAAAEMRERARQLIGKAAQHVLISTFHALGVRLLRQDGSALGLKENFSILDSDDVLSLLKDCAGGTTDAARARQWQWTISRWKNAGLDAAAALAQVQNEDEYAIAQLMQRYQERLTAYQAVDFDDLIGLPLKLLREHPEVRARWQQQLGHVLVDEYQDTNATQYELLKLLVGQCECPQPRLTAVGDNDQSIYGWRGATLDNLKKLPVDFPTLAVIKLEQNYRCTSAILRAANHLIGANPKLYPKTLWSELGEGEPVRVQACEHEEHEAERVVARIQSLRATGAGGAAREFKDFCVLYRANHQSRSLEHALRKAQIPYRVSGGTSFFDRAEIRDLCAWLRLLLNPDDDPAFLRAITTPKRGIGHQTLAALGALAHAQRSSLYAALSAHSLPATVSPRALHGLHEFGRCIHDLAERARHTHGSAEARAFLSQWLSDIGYEQHLHAHETHAKAAAERWANVQDFCDWMAKRCAPEADATPGTAAATGPSLLEVAQTVALVSTLAEREQDPNVVTLSTLHAAKGLEWPHVMLVGVNEGLLPFLPYDDPSPSPATSGSSASPHSTPSEPDPATALRLQEERRLMYVGITRARQTLWVSWLKTRKKGRQTIAGRPSRFIDEMKLDEATRREDPREKLRALRAEFAARAAQKAASTTP